MPFATRTGWLPALVPLALTAVLLSVNQQAQAVLIASDAFHVTGDGAGGSYNTSVDNARVYGKNPTSGVTGFSNTWSNADNSTTTVIKVETGSLTHPLELDNAPGDAYAGRNLTPGASRTVTRQLSAYDQGQSEYYMSSLLRANGVSDSTATDRIGVGLNTALTNNSGRKVEWGYTDDEIDVWLNGTPTTLLDSYTLGETYLLTLGIEVDAVGANERVTATLFNSTGIAVNNVEITNQDISIADLDYLRLNAINTGAYATAGDVPRFDNFRFGTTLGDVRYVVPAPEPGSFVLLGLGTLLLPRSRRRRKNRVG